eukprot:COSAG06_NODE_7_length_38054_cov_37.302569_20_plen_88_part_00
MLGAAFEVLLTPVWKRVLCAIRTENRMFAKTRSGQTLKRNMFLQALPVVEKAKQLGIVACKWVLSLAVAAGLIDLQHLVASLISGRF